jgi:hypothetical protein
VTSAIEASLGEEQSSAPTNSRAVSIAGEPGRLCATKAETSWVAAEQQFGWAVLFDSGAGMQQLWSLPCVLCRQVPGGAIIAPISKTATKARWKMPIRMRAVYHARCLLT